MGFAILMENIAQQLHFKNAEIHKAQGDQPGNDDDEDPGNFRRHKVTIAFAKQATNIAPVLQTDGSQIFIRFRMVLTLSFWKDIIHFEKWPLVPNKIRYIQFLGIVLQR
jgi:hypothetical protein